MGFACAVEHLDGVVWLIPEEGERLFVSMGSVGNPASLIDGWRPLFAFTDLSPFILLELIHQGGMQATWILDAAGLRVAGQVSELPVAVQAEMRRLASGLVTRDVSDLISAPSPSALAKLELFLRLNPTIRRELTGPLDGTILPPLRPHRFDATTELTIPTAGGADIFLSNGHLASCLGDDLTARYLAACRSGQMCFLSPFDGGEVAGSKGFVLSTLIMVWRCVEPVAQFVYYIVVTGFEQEIAGLYIPATGDLVCLPRRTFTSVDAFDLPIGDLIAQHVAAHHESLPGFLSAPPRRFAQFTWPDGAAHLGHYIWNELSGLETITSRLDTASYPLLFDLGGAAGCDFFGPLYGLFPELKGFISTEFRTIPDLLAYCYKSGIQTLRFSGSYVTANLRQRVRNAVADTPEAPTARAAAGKAKGPILLFGLRVENRTVTDLAWFLVELARRLFATCGEMTIIIDGHNSRARQAGGSEHRSFLEGRARRPPIEVERSVVTTLRGALAHLPITIVDCVGMTILDNLAWAQIADMAIAPWGAGLAKYRWICNTPTYVLASRFNQTHKADLHIYSDPTFMEDPSAQWMVPPALVTDRPDAEVLAQMDPVHVPYYVNYEVDCAALVAEISDHLAGLHRQRLAHRMASLADFRIENDVVLGADGELFLANGGHRVLEHSIGLRSPIATSFRNFRGNIAQRAACAANLGAKYLHVVFPDKQSVLPERCGIPDIILLGDRYRQACADVWDDVLYPVDTLRQLAQPFLRTDTHMTIDGTFATVECMIQRLYGDALDPALRALRTRLSGELSYTGDLGSKLEPPQSEMKRIMQVDSKIVWIQNKMGSGNNGLTMISTFEDAPVKGRLVFFGDSFGRDCCTVLAHIFTEVVFLRSPFLHREELLALRPQVLITGNVERYLAFVEADEDAPAFQTLQWFKHDVDPEQRRWAEAFSAILSDQRGPYRRWINRQTYRAQ